MSVSYYQNTLNNSIDYRWRLLDVDTDISSDKRAFLKSQLSEMLTQVNNIIKSKVSTDEKIKQLQSCIMSMNVNQIGVA